MIDFKKINDECDSSAKHYRAKEKTAEEMEIDRLNKYLLFQDAYFQKHRNIQETENKELKKELNYKKTIIENLEYEIQILTERLKKYANNK